MMLALRPWLVLFAGLTLGCDVAPDPDSQAWDIALIAPDAVPSWGPVRVQFDRRLSPWSIGRSTARLTSGTVGEFVFPAFDPITRQLHLELTRPMLTGANYVVTMTDLVDLDGDVLNEPLQLLLSPVESERQPAEASEPAVVLRALSEACAQAGCHDDSSRAAAGLNLASADGLRRTAIGQPAKQVASVNQLAPTIASGLIDLPIIDAEGTSQSPSRSYLLYKMLGDAHVLGEAMPPPASADPVDAASIDQVARWIRGGARLE